MNSITEDGIIIYIMSFLDRVTCCKNSSVFNFSITNKHYLTLLKQQKLFSTKKIKYFKLTDNIKKLLNNDLASICSKCKKIDHKGLEFLIRECKNYFYNHNYFRFSSLPLDKDNGFYIHFKCDKNSLTFRKYCITSLPNLNIGNTCCGGKGFQIIFN